MGTSIINVRTQSDVLEESYEADRESVSERPTNGLAALDYGVFFPVRVRLGVEDGFPCLPDVPIDGNLHTGG
jgi:hypothetical protein